MCISISIYIFVYYFKKNKHIIVDKLFLLFQLEKKNIKFCFSIQQKKY